MGLLRLIFCALLAAPPGFAAGPAPSGEVAELHDCEVFTGSCTASGEATQGGRAALRVWKIDRGAFRGQALAGARVAVLETADANLAADPDVVSRAMVYLPPGLEPARRDALLAWLRERALRPGTKVLAVRESPVELTATRETVNVQVGTVARFRAAALPSCGMASCGESMIYEPRSPHAAFVALLNEDSSVTEPKLALSWRAHGLRSVFLARFGDDAPPRGPAFPEGCHDSPAG